MIAPIKNIRNKFSSTLAFNNYDSNMALDMNNVDMIDDYVVNNVIFLNSDNNDKMRGCTLALSTTSSCSVLYFCSNKSEKLYMDQMWRESDSMVQDKPTALSDSIQLKYATQEVQNPIISKVANTPPNTRTICRHNITSTYVNSIVVNPTAINNSDIINIQLNYNINQPLDSNS